MKVQLRNLGPGTLMVSPKTQAQYGFPDKPLFHLGNWRRELTLRVSEDMDDETLGLPRRWTQRFDLPASLEYDLHLDGRHVHLGPVIGLLLYARSTAFNEARLEKHTSYLAHYPSLRGLVYLCALDGIDTEKQTIEGYYYDPQAQGLWVPGKFPFPGALYRKTGMGSRVYNELVEALGDRIFNTYFFDKWEMYQALSTEVGVAEHLPHTEKVSDRARLDALLSEYGSVYLKQRSGEKAKGIMRVMLDEDGRYLITFRFLQEKHLKGPEEVDDLLADLKARDYIMQEGLNMPRHEGRNLDFRVILQKNQQMRWQASGMIGRFGKKNSIVTNFILHGYAKTGIESLQLAYGLSQREAFVKEQEIVEICRRACYRLEQTLGHYGDLGFDVIVDKDLRVWILEINKLHDHGYPLYALEDQQMYHKVVTTPLGYAKAIAGFPLQN